MKNLLFSAATILAVSSSALAQLYVAPNASTSTDTYIYAENVQLYVDGTIQLEKNSAGPTEASFYLRDEAQLIQGGSNNSNSGDGMISVYQEGIADSYDYNAWSSPVTQPTATGNQNFGELNVYNELGITDSNLANFVGGLNGNSTATTLNIADRWFHRWDIAAQGFVRISDNHDVAAGQGFIMKGTNVTPEGTPELNAQLYDFRGRPNSGDITIDLPSSTSPVAGTYVGGNILIGNPYPSALDLNLFFYDAANNGPTGSGNKFSMISFYDEDRTINSHLFTDNKAGYGTWTPGPYQPDLSVGVYNPGNYVIPQFQNFASDGTPIGDAGVGAAFEGPHVERRMSPIGQGFFVQSINTATDTDVTFNNSQRRFIKETNTTFNSQFRTIQQHNDTGGVVQIEPVYEQPAFFAPQLRINTYMGVSHMRQTLLILHDSTTDDFDNGWDGLSPMDATSEMYFPLQTPFDEVNDFPFVINAMPFDDIYKKIPFTLVLEEQMNVVISGIEEIDLPTDSTYVWDSLHDKYQKITGGESASLFLSAGEYSDRFYIVFTASSYLDFAENQDIDTEDRSFENTNDLVAVSFFQNNIQTQLEVANPDAMEISSASIFDMRGRLVLNQQNLGNNSKFTFNTGTFSDGTYIVILTTPDNQTIDYKIIVQNR